MRTLTSCLAVAIAPLALLMGCAAAPEGPSSHSFDETEAEGGAAASEGDDGGTTDCDGGSCSRHSDAGHAGDGGQRQDAQASCEQSNACESARDLGAVSGDTGNDTLSATGAGSTWLKVRV